MAGRHPIILRLDIWLAHRGCRIVDGLVYLFRDCIPGDSIQAIFRREAFRYVKQSPQVGG